MNLSLRSMTALTSTESFRCEAFENAKLVSVAKHCCTVVLIDLCWPQRIVVHIVLIAIFLAARHLSNVVSFELVFVAQHLRMQSSSRVCLLSCGVLDTSDTQDYVQVWLPQILKTTSKFKYLRYSQSQQYYDSDLSVECTSLLVNNAFMGTSLLADMAYFLSFLE